MFDDLLEDEYEESEDGAVIGIDLGTTNTVAAYVADGEVHIIVDDENNALQPSIVAWTPSGERLVGAAARPRRVIDPANTVYSAKRIIGQSFRAGRVQQAIKHLPYEVVEGEHEEPLIVTRAGRHPVPEISSYVLTHVKQIAERTMGKQVTHCVVTVPANFSDGQRAATRQAAARADMEVLRILNEPTAAAVAYGRNRGLHERIAIFDLGGGTFDVTLLAVRGNLYEVIATGGDPFLGGDDIDRKIADYLAVEFLKQHRIDPNADPVARARLLLAAEQIKVYLSSEMVAEGTLAEVAYGEGGAPLSLDFHVDREQLEQLIEPLVTRSLEMAVGVLSEAGVSPERVDEVILVGGSTRVPLVQRRVAEYFGRQAKTNINPMHVVALGAAAQAHNLFYPDDTSLTSGGGGGGGGGGGVLIDVTPHSLGIQTAGGYTQRLIEKNTRIPAEGRKIFTTAHNDQTSVQIKVCQGEEHRYAENVPLGELTLDDIPKLPRGEAQLEVAFFIDADGIVQVSAVELRSNTKANANLSAIGVNEER